MSTFTYRSFIYGVAITSLTWAASIYLYMVLTNSNSANLTNSESSPNINDDSISYQPLRSRGIFNNPNSVNSYQLHNLHLGGRSFAKPSSKLQPPGHNDFVESDPKSNSKWKTKFQELVDLAEDEGYKNSEKLVNSLKSKTFIKDGDDKVISALDSIGLIRTLEDKKVRDEGYHKHSFNALISERLGYHRFIPDTRHEQCRFQTYPDYHTLPSASVIICFYNEEFHTLIRTVHSILDRSTPSLLHEILLIDDSSDLDNIHSRVLEYSKKNFPAKVSLLQTPSRAGLIRARIFGARHATGDALVFLDSHVEPNTQWLEPLLTRIHEDRKTVVTPIIDLINPDTFEYSASPLVKGGFNWGLHFRWDPVLRSEFKTQEDFVKPIVSPTMAGGLFAIEKQYFVDLGEYDEGMDVWGGENTEMSFRIWMCGGRLEIMPCSRVGHVFRKRRPYGGDSDGVDSSTKNSKRVAEVWMDEYKNRYYEIHPEAKSVDTGDISSRVALRKKLECKSFQWYLDHVYPEILMEDKGVLVGHEDSVKKPKEYIESFMLRLSHTNLCVETEGKVVTQKSAALVLGKCSGITKKKQRWSETQKHELVLAEVLCLDAGSEVPKLKKCHEMGGTQEWKRAGEKETPIFNLASGLCLGVQGYPQVGSGVSMVICDEMSAGNTHLKFDLLSGDNDL